MNKIEYQILENQIAIMGALKSIDNISKSMKSILTTDIIETQSLVIDIKEKFKEKEYE